MLVFMLTKQTITHQPSTTHQVKQNVLPISCYQEFPWELTILPRRLQGFSQWFEKQPQPNCLFESHSDPQVSYQHRALYKLFKIYL